VGRFDTANGEVIPYSDKAPERCEPPRGPAFLLPGEDEPRRCGSDPDMPPVKLPRRVRRGFEDLKR